MIELFYWTSANAQKILIFLEEVGGMFTLTPLNVGRGEQYLPDFVRISPNSRIPAIVDHAPAFSDEPLAIFESGAILIYLAEKFGAHLSADPVRRMETLQWLFWQVGGLGPMGGQIVHFRNYAPEPIDYALKRYGAENERLLAVLDRRLQGRDYIAGAYSIADMACFPWIFAHARRDQIDLDALPDLKRWFLSIRERPAVERAYATMADFTGGPVVKNHAMMDDEARRILFGAHAVK
ncbi:MULTISPECIES: glutathione binding-like protein [unclassified Sphingomonas]|uniref:glutathione binding-like protein n=1 Tax=unclassified Sphingomonas TaxID=196159 RepID=UPI0006F5658B|nr:MULTISPECIES: glutathione binding-like protein [unclassified Sphingomonas]KQX23607.1 glutathione S-transferase [Sphingomonas sp. Root1294]KQY68454.1 glutathione S-transferase [Sphingomonas sp. Root50]KRB91410.1 glutathione S-transferase [Sphingomonas sp. Root720]